MIIYLKKELFSVFLGFTTYNIRGYENIIRALWNPTIIVTNMLSK